VTTPRDVRLVRAPTLRAAHRAIAGLAVSAAESLTELVVLVASRQAARELRRTIAALAPPDSVFTRPDAAEPRFVTRAGLYDELHRRLGPNCQPLLTSVERTARFWRASATAIAGGLRPPFTVRPGLVAEMLALYDGVRRNKRTIGDFDRVLVNALEPGAEADRGATRLLSQTQYLTAVFREYERALVADGAVDEHRLRDLVVTATLSPPLSRIVLTMADQAGEADGLWPADFDLLTRLSGLAAIDVIVTEHALDAGFRERLFEWLPGIVEASGPPAHDAMPVLVVPSPAGAPAYHAHRDREEELHAVAAYVASDMPHTGISADPSADDVLVVYGRPLPYLYVAHRIFRAAGFACTTADTLPLAAEPYAAAVDLVFDAIASGLSREPLLRLLESPLLTWRADGRRLPLRDLDLLRTWCRQHRFVAGHDEVVRVVRALQDHPPSGPAGVRLRRALDACAQAAEDLRLLDAERPWSAHFETLSTLLRRRDAYPDSAAGERHARARAATLDVLATLARAYAQPGEPGVRFREVVPVVRRAMEEHTFAPATGTDGIRLVDARAARYATAGIVWILGVNEGVWPAPARGSVFYPASLLRDLGFPRDQDRRLFARAAFRDLLTMGRHETAVSVFQLEDDAIVRPSVLVEDLDELPLERRRARALPIRSLAGTGLAPPTPGEPEWAQGLVSQTSSDRAPAGPRGAWLARRRRLRPLSGDERFHGQAGPPAARVFSVTQIERYLECPFRYFASVAVGLPEEATRDELGLDPRKRGSLVHEVFQSFFDRWTAAGHRSITVSLLPVAREMFAEVVTRALERLPEADRVIEQARLIGSAAAPGLGERVFRLEAVRGADVLERLIEFDLRGTYDFAPSALEAPDASVGPVGPVRLKGIADRIDLLADGTLRIIDYKTGRAPQPRRSVQLAMYALCAEHKLAGYRGRTWRVGEAAYLALGATQPWVQVIRSPEDRAPLDLARIRVAAALERLARGSFPAAPVDRRLCTVCAFASVCRRDYRADVA
jgi:RecB family exonuclease